MSTRRPRSYANGVARARARIEDPDGPRAGMLSHTERKLREAITDAYLVLAGLAEVEGAVAKTLADAQQVYWDTSSTPERETRLAEALYCHGPSVTHEMTQARLLAPESVVRRFGRIAERPRRLDERLPVSARAIEYGGSSVGEWLEESMALADLLDTYRDAIVISLTRLVDVEAHLSAYVTGERAFRPAATAALASKRFR